MKKFVRVMSAAMSAALVLTAMAGCGGSKDSGGSSDGKIKIGGIGPYHRCGGYLRPGS